MNKDAGLESILAVCSNLNNQGGQVKRETNILNVRVCHDSEQEVWQVWKIFLLYVGEFGAESPPSACRLTLVEWLGNSAHDWHDQTWSHNGKSGLFPTALIGLRLE